jgi:hypothetical protein
VAAVRQAVTKNDTIGLAKLLDPRKPDAPASILGILTVDNKGDGNGVVDEVLTQPLAQSSDTEGLTTLHQLAVERHPRHRGRPPKEVLGDAAAYLESFPMSDELPNRLAPWQRSNPEPDTLKMVRVLRQERDDGYAPFLPPPVYWENRQAAIENGREDTVMMSNTCSTVPMWPVQSSVEEKETNEIRQARMQGRTLIRKSSPTLKEPISPSKVEGSSEDQKEEGDDVKSTDSLPQPPVKMSLEERAMARAKAAEDRARERADQQLSELRYHHNTHAHTGYACM